MNSSSKTQIFVKGFPPSISESDLESDFRSFGKIQSITLKKAPNSYPYAFIVR
jgi:RNA recognition motif-containing protein